MATTKKTVKILGEALENLEKYRDEAITQREKDSIVTIKVVGSEDIVLNENQSLFFDGLIKTLNTTIDQTKKSIQELMYPTSPSRGE